MLQGPGNIRNRKFGSNEVSVIQLLSVNPVEQRFLSRGFLFSRRPLMDKQVEIKWTAMFFDGNGRLVDNTLDTN
jgi:hypothetical protein